MAMLIGSSRSCDIPIPIVPKARPRVDRGGTHMPERYRQCVRDIGMILATVFGNDRGWPTHQAYAVELNVEVGPHGGDVDNLLGTVLDAGNGIVWDDDRQVVVATVTKRRATQQPRARLRVTILDGMSRGVGHEPREAVGNPKRGGVAKRTTRPTSNRTCRAPDAGKGPSRGSKG